jgi:hypothetical protein
MYIEGSSLILDNHNIGLHTVVVDESFFDSWHHVAWSFDAPVSSIYIDGVLRSSRSYWSAMGVSDKPLTIGSYPTEPNGHFAGYICDVSIWSVARTGDDIVHDYQGIDPSTVGLVGFWKLNDGSGLTALDSGPFKYDGTLTGGIGSYPIWVMLVGPLTSGNRWVVDFAE